MFKKYSYLFVFIILVFLFTQKLFSQKNSYPYKNPALPLEDRVEDLLGRMTLEEKFWQLFMIPGNLSDGKEKYKKGIFGFQVATRGSSKNAAEQILNYSSSGTASAVAEKINEIQRYFVEETTHGIPIIAFDEALHGLVRDGATAFPQAIALAATWDTALMGDVGAAIAKETKSRGIRQILSPVLNIARDVRWGRTEETYGEDPFLTTQMGLAFIREFEERGVITTPKHFIANVGDGGRDSYPIHFNERLLEEIYFPAFKAAFQKAGAWSVMTSYNSLDGSPCTANNWLLNKKLKHEWGFEGFVISDAGATGGANVLHFTAADYAESTKNAIENGLDVIFQTSYAHYPLFYKAFESGMIDIKNIDEAVRRVLRVKFKLGLFEDPYVNPDEAARWNGHTEHRQLAKQAALESIILLKNSNQILPFKPDIKSVAVIGPDAVEARLGGYSGPGINKVSILDGLKKRAGESTEIHYEKGCGRNSAEYVTIPAENLFHMDEGQKRTGLLGAYFNNIMMEGEPDLKRIDRMINFRWTLFSPDPEKINYDWYSVQWEGKLVGPESGKINIGIEGNDGYRLYLDGKLLIDNWQKQTFRRITTPYQFKKGQVYTIKIEYYESAGDVRLKLIWDAGIQAKWKEEIARAVKVAGESDMALVLAGIDEGEFQDRAYLNLPGHQEELIRDIAKSGTPIVVVLIGGSAITMHNWIDNVGAVVDAWYPGEVGGEALAEVLFGDYNPAGRLPITFPMHESQLPLYYNHKPTGRGDDYLNLTGKPLFPFGFGRSFTTFKYSDLKIDKTMIDSNESAEVSFLIQNTGQFAGDEVVQLYIRDIISSVVRPLRELKGFQRIYLKPGERQKITFKITTDLLSMLDKDLNPALEPGDFRIMIGASSVDIRLRGIVTVKN